MSHQTLFEYATRHVPSLHVRGFRGFAELRIERFAHANLLVGPNSIGKTTLLEALWLLEADGQDEVILELLRRRGELSRSSPDEEHIAALQSLFHSDAEGQRFSLNTLDGGRSLDLRLTWARREGREYLELDEDEADAHPDSELMVFIDRAHGKQTARKAADLLSGRARPLARPNPLAVSFVPARGLSEWELSKLWDKVVLTPHEENVIEALRIIEPRLRRISFVDGRSSRGRSPLVLLEGAATAVPLRRMGDGICRLFEVALVLSSNTAGLLLVDEVESGIHYGALTRYWVHLLDLAQALQVQIFATTHSLDCIRAFQAATAEHDLEGALLRLDRSPDGKVFSVPFDEDELEIAVKRDIEVR